LSNIYDIFKERGFIEHVTGEDMLRETLHRPISCYIGFDPTATSLHVGSLLPIMSLAHMQREGHRPIVVVGGGTALVGDPSGRDEIRPVMTREEIDNNAAAESYRRRLESGLSFLEFNYMLLQAYDFWHLFKNYDCVLQMGGSDQWGNILAGVDLTRRLEGKIIHGLTFPLITTADGQKMGKTHKGAIWLDSGLTSPYEYYQYWINTDDRDVKRFFYNFTFLPLREIEELSGLRGEELRRAKEVLAYETTKICHGQDAADKARRAARQLFREKVIEDVEGIPMYSMTFEELGDGIEAYILFQNTDLCATRSEARRLISQGGAYLNGKRIPSFETKIGPDDIQNDTIVLRVGKKKYLKVNFQDL